jgi:hypothetical protein
MPVDFLPWKRHFQGIAMNTQRPDVSILFALAAMIVLFLPVRAQSHSEHVAWVADEFIRMQAIKPGMNRGDLLEVFTIEGGLFTGLTRRFVSKNCPYFKVDVEFRAVGRPARDPEGRVTLFEDVRDVIVTISQPYLQFSIMD